MKIVQLALAGAALLALSACGSRNEDAVENVDAMAPSQADQLNSLADDAANQAEAEALGAQQQDLEDEADNGSDAADVEPTQDPDENVSGM